ncbi:MAG: maleylpyruvate isomerase family mycothiol-dependent enzyme [Acidimicrobiales bacterium]|nr:maleylpyruvate isomerase family mycothiol-dependent enzyme [Acidimicrobiales bacterium]
MSDLARAYVSTHDELQAALGGLDAASSRRRVPATPGWTVTDVVRHLAGLASDVLDGDAPRGLDLVATAEDAHQRALLDGWTLAQVLERSDQPLAEVLGAWAARLPDLEALLAGRRPGADTLPPFITAHLVTDLVVHAGDLGDALGQPLGRDPLGTEVALGTACFWLARRLQRHGLAPLALYYDDKVRMLGDGHPGASLTAGRDELLAALVGRRGPDEIRALRWHGDVDAYAPLLAAFGPPVES